MRDSGAARRWLDQARHNLEVARAHLRLKFHSDACFMAEQAAQVALKAFLLSRGERFVPLHSVAELADLCASRSKAFAPAVEWGKVLDKFYIPTRYPDALAPPAVPYKIYTAREAREAVGYAERILGLVSRAAGRGGAPAAGR